MCKKIVNKRRKRTSFRYVNVNKTRSKSLRFNFYVVLQPATRSSRSPMFFKIGALKRFFKIHRKTPVSESHFSHNFIKKRLWDRCFSVNFAKLFRTPFASRHLRWLVLCNSTSNSEASR